MDGCFRVIQLGVLFLASVLEATKVFRVVLFCLGLSVSTSNYDDIICHTDDSLQPIQCLGETFLEKSHCLLTAQRVIVPSETCQRV